MYKKTNQIKLGGLDLSRFIHMILMQISTWTSLDLKSLDFKNLDQEIKKFGLSTMDNLNKF